MGVEKSNEGAVAKTGMLIRKPVAKVFEAFTDPAITTRFWFTKSTGMLRVGETVTWHWEMYGASTQVMPKAIEPDRRIVIEWDGYTGRTTVEWRFAPHDGGLIVFGASGVVLGPMLLAITDTLVRIWRRRLGIREDGTSAGRTETT